jgi:CRP/FNR family cyclic AMP-dependent transcriptional regulator
MSCIDGKPRSASVVALEPCEVLYVTAPALLDALQDNFDAAMYLLLTAVTRLRRANEKILSLALMDVRGRVARLIIDAAHPIDGEWVVDIGSEEIARTVGASREMVSRVVKQMAENGLIKRDRRRIVVLDRASLPSSHTVH